MIGLKGRMNVIDNSGAVIAEVINVIKVKTRAKSTGHATVGDEVTCVINKARPITLGGPATNVQKVRRGDVRRAVIVRTKKPIMRSDGRVVRFDDNACVLLNNKGDVLGTRITGVVSAELRKIDGGADPNGRWSKVLSLAPKIV
ncbi:54S ribosomal protein L38, mitochondrial [Vanrija albida]|uniref:54S ribosomal protein L38, mitochondrial n=1 Tax=Vanrija albida TaxID=181172 RepID=A0ABR3PSI1_9TREE